MISLWYANPGEDFKLTKIPTKTVVITAELAEFDMQTLIGNTLPVVAKQDDVIYAVFAKRRLAFSKEQALKIYGDITGKTATPPEINTAPTPCSHDCSKCSGCH